MTINDGVICHKNPYVSPSEHGLSSIVPFRPYRSKLVCLCLRRPSRHQQQEEKDFFLYNMFIVVLFFLFVVKLFGWLNFLAWDLLPSLHGYVSVRWCPTLRQTSSRRKFSPSGRTSDTVSCRSGAIGCPISGSPCGNGGKPALSAQDAPLARYAKQGLSWSCLL